MNHLPAGVKEIAILMELGEQLATFRVLPPNHTMHIREVKLTGKIGPQQFNQRATQEQIVNRREIFTRRYQFKGRQIIGNIVGFQGRRQGIVFQALIPALKGLNGKDVEGRTLSVSIAREREERGGGRNSSPRSGNKRFF